jgi:hypothetical protein
VEDSTVRTTLQSLALAGLLLAPAGVQACDEDPDEMTAVADTSFNTRVVVREGAWLDSEMDTNWTDVEPGLFLVRLRRPTGAWVAETWYFRLATDLRHVYTFEELRALADAHALDGREPYGMIRDQVLVYARDEAQAARLARAMRPAVAPPRVVAAALR